MALPKRFYLRDAATVAQELLGCVLVKRDKTTLAGMIVETEAYYGLSDPASRAKHTKMAAPMWHDAGIAFIYMVHGHWLFNITTMPKGSPSGVLIRAVEPLKGTELMMERRGTGISNLTSGPGKFTKAFGIDSSHNGMKVYDRKGVLYIREGRKNFEIARSGRIGVREDLPVPLRFYIRGNRFVSRP